MPDLLSKRSFLTGAGLLAGTVFTVIATKDGTMKSLLQSIRSRFQSPQAAAATPNRVPMPARLEYEASIANLRTQGVLSPEEKVRIPGKMPAYDDERLVGLNFFRTEVDKSVDFSNLTIPRTFFGRSEIDGVSFQNADMHESSFCWNDFIGVNFTYGDFEKSDFRASNYERCRFDHANLKLADFRHSGLVACTFSDASLESAIFAKQQIETLNLSPAQLAQIDLRNDEGPEPGGG